MSVVVHRNNRTVLATAAVLSVLGVVTATVGALWVAGSLGISAAAASQIVSAIVAGGWALRVVMFTFGAGLIGAIAVTVMWYVTNRGTNVAVA
jgi:hypothetical protein